VSRCQRNVSPRPYSRFSIPGRKENKLKLKTTPIYFCLNVSNRQELNLYYFSIGTKNSADYGFMFTSVHNLGLSSFRNHFSCHRAPLLLQKTMIKDRHNRKLLVTAHTIHFVLLYVKFHCRRCRVQKKQYLVFHNMKLLEPLFVSGPGCNSEKVAK
jgi:hypothetical protein